MAIEVSITIDKIPLGCPAEKDYGCRYGIGISGNSFGMASPCKDKEEIIKAGNEYIKSETEYYNDKIKIIKFVNETDLDITLADFQGDNKLTQWF